MGCLKLTYQPIFELHTHVRTPSREAKCVQMWLSVDPLAEKYLGWSPYNYTLLNPVKFTDPTGMAVDNEYDINKKTGEKTKVSNKGGSEMNYYNLGTTNEEGEFQTETTLMVKNPNPGKNSLVSEKGKEFIQSFENLSHTTYDANPPTGDWTIGWGHKILPNEDFSNGISLDKANSLFHSDLWNIAVVPIFENVKVPLTQQQFDALSSYTFNVGKYNSVISTQLVRHLNAGHYFKAALEMDIVTGNGKYLKGLDTRRQAEQNIWNNGIYEMH